MSKGYASGSIGVKLKPGMRRKLILTGTLLIGLCAVLSFSPYEMRMTISESVDHSLFLINKSQTSAFERGDYVSVKAPDDPNSGDEYVKIVGGLPGDEVEVRGRDIYVAGVYRGSAKEVSLTGRSLEVIRGGIIPEGHIYLFAPHKDSYDSRYAEIGFVPLSFVIGAAKPVV